MMSLESKHDEIKNEADNHTTDKNDASIIEKSDVIKSSAIVKHAAVIAPVQYHELQFNFDLNQPPPNWLHLQSKLERFIYEFSLGKQHNFTSFTMAHNFPDLTGKIDVISDAENIKKLLKIPWSKSQISLMVHRVGNTLLLDDFDVHSHLLRQQKCEWAWLNNFYIDTVLENLQEKIKKCAVKKNKSRNHLQNQNMFSKFLYHSMAQASLTSGDLSNETKEEVETFNSKEHLLSSVNLSNDIYYVTDEASNRAVMEHMEQTLGGKLEHQRTVVWDFEDIRMLVGTDLPIFSSGSHPSVSLRLRDMCRPINVLTGLDYWLDNLMCNVPELAMCYHLNGLVQSYELLKTDDLPQIPSCRFSPVEVKDIAQNILTFLKDNATREGHTYWLFKAHGDDIVKLYDLTALCSEEDSAANSNPFAIHLGLLLYRVACNTWQHHNEDCDESGIVRTLLQCAIKLLNMHTHAYIISSAYLLLASLYLSDSCHLDSLQDVHYQPSTHQQVNQIETGEFCAEKVSDTASVQQIDTQKLCHSSKINRHHSYSSRLHMYEPVDGTLSQRCNAALKNIVEGLQCVDSSSSEAESETFCDPSVAIPLNYCTLSQSMHKTPTTSSRLPPQSWHVQCKFLLILKASACYCTLAQLTSVMHLRWQYLRLGLLCYSGLRSMLPKKAMENELLLSHLLMLTADWHMIQLKQDNENVNISDGSNCSSNDIVMSACVEKSVRLELDEWEYSWLCEFSLDTAICLEKCALLYRLAQESLGRATTVSSLLSKDIASRIGNCHNELGVYYMKLAENKLKEQDRETAEVTWRRGFLYFRDSLHAFDSISDFLNMALVHCNIGRLCRLCAEASVEYIDNSLSRAQFNQQERLYFCQAQENYGEALNLLHTMSTSYPEQLHDTVSWELCNSHFFMAALEQDNPPLNILAQEQIEEDVIKHLKKALEVLPSYERVEYQYRAATIHHRLASLYNHTYRNQNREHKRKKPLNDSEYHYSEAFKLFEQLQSPLEAIKVQLERVALLDEHLKVMTSNQSQRRILIDSLQHLIKCQQPINWLMNQLESYPTKWMPRNMTNHPNTSLENSDNESYFKQDLLENNVKSLSANNTLEDKSNSSVAEKLLLILQSKLQSICQNLVKYASSLGKVHSSAEVAVFKAWYGAVLKNSTVDVISLQDRCRLLMSALNELLKLTDNHISLYS